MKDNTNSFLAGLTVASLVYIGIIVFTGALSKSTWQERAVKAGKAEYYLDADNNKQWRWK